MKVFFALTTLLLIGGTKSQSITDKLTELGCTTLLTVLTAENLIGTLEGLENVTLFAPTNDALDNAVLPDDLAPLLTFHAVPTAVASTDIVDDTTAESVNGAFIRLNIYKGSTVYTAQGVLIDLSNVDAVVDNGYIHVINGVMLPPSQNIFEIVNSTDDFSVLRDAVNAAGIEDVISGTDPLTVFAPNNDAFALVPTAVLDNLLQNPAELGALLTSHAIGDTYFSAGLSDGDSVSSVEGSSIDIVINENGVFISPENAQVISADVSATNGVVHVINRVMNLPVKSINQTLQDIGCTVLASVLSSTTSGGQTLMDTLEGLGEVTLFAPTNAALEAAGTLPTGDALINLLTYHAYAGTAQSSDIVNDLLIQSVSGSSIRFNIYDDSTLYTAQGAPIDLQNVDITVTNGFIHILDAVMFPPSQNIVELVSSDPDFSTLASAVVAADLVELLSGEGPFTVFAPNNEAFDNVPENVLTDLLADTEALSNVVLYHAASATVFSAALDNNDVIDTAQGDQMRFIINSNGVFINDTDYAQIIATDIPVTNGVVHVVNRVLKVVTNADVDGATSLSSHTSLIFACFSLFMLLKLR